MPSGFVVRIQNKKTMTQQKRFDIIISSSAGSIYRAEIFNALADRTTQMNPALDAINAAFISTNVAQQTLAGQIKLAAQGNAFGVIGWADLFGLNTLQHFNNAGTESVIISSGSNVFTYRQIIEWLKTESIFIKKVKIQCQDVSQLKKEWQLIQRLPDGTERKESLYFANIITPDQVRTDVATFELNRVIDKYTAIHIDITPINFQTTFTFEYDIIKL